MDGTEFKVYYPTAFFYPFTKGVLYFGKIWEKEFSRFDLQFYDLTEFLFYTVAPILIYYIITLFNSKDQTPQQ
jgi:hypothetical protein